MEIKCDANPRISLTLDGRAEITFTTSRGNLGALEGLKDKELLVKISSFSKRRSLSQNAYMWVLIGELSSKLGIPKEEVYRSYIKDYGTYEVLPIKAEAVERFVSSWKSHGIGWVCEVLKESKLQGFVNVIAYYGSSSYCSSQLSKLLDAVVSDCSDQGIFTMTMKDIMLLRNENDSPIR